jgi:diguanylate cyclase (GGDEF)-like protein/PAS domain S-box-containing protein
MTSSPTPSRVFAALRRHGLALLVPCSILAITFGGYRDNLQKEEASRLLLFQAQARVQVNHLRERAGSLLQLAEKLHTLRPESTGKRPDGLGPVLAQHPEILRVGVLRRGPGGSLITDSAEPSPSDPLPATAASLRDALPALGGKPMLSAPYALPGDGAQGRQAVLILRPLPGTRREFAFIEVGTEPLLRHGVAPDEGLSGAPRFAVDVLDITDAPRPVFTSAAAPGSHDSTTKSLGAYAEGITLAQRHWLVIVSPGAAATGALLDSGSGRWLVGGLLLTLLAIAIQHTVQSRADAVRRQVDEKTQALAAANDALGRYIGALADANRRLASEVDEHARAESQLRETTSLQRAILDCAEYAVIYTDAKGTIRVINPAAERLFGYRADELIDKATPQILHPDEHAPRWTLEGGTIGLISLPPGSESHTAELDMRRHDGSLFPVSLSVSIVRDTPGQIRGYLGIIADITQRVDAESRIRHLAHYDNLTSLPNRSLLNRHLADVLSAARARHRRVAVLVTDLDHFKYVNDTLGHLAGDQLLLAVAQRLRTGVRDGDLVARTGGDEFVIVLADLDETYLPEEAGERLLASVARPFELAGHQLTVTISVGIALYPHDGVDGDTLVKNADAAMYLAKERGRNQARFFDHGLSRRYSERLELEGRLRQAVEARQLALYYQPQVDTLSGELIGMEALIRWCQPDGSMVPPDKFIPIAEECGLIVPIGAWVLREACRQQQAWLQEGISRVPVGVNLSARQFDDTTLLATIQAALAESGLPPAYLDLELTESLVMGNPEHTRQVLAECKQLGLQLSVDDFGTGYSSLSYLKRFPIDRLKIDRSFIADIVTEPDDAAIAQTIIAMAHTLRLEVIAEGVETEAQLALLRRWRCDAYQGYLCSRPLPADEMTKLLRQLRATRQVALANI